MEDATDRPSYEPELAEPPTPSPKAKYSPLQRLWMMFTSPGEVFADIGLQLRVATRIIRTLLDVAVFDGIIVDGIGVVHALP